VKTAVLIDTGPLVTFLAGGLKHADFLIYRRHGNKVIPVLMPE
jgi:hypothetical protein